MNLGRHKGNSWPSREDEKDMIKEARFFRLGVMFLMAVAGLTFIAGSAWAQGDQRLPLDKAVMSGENAKKSLTKYQVSADVARKLVDSCVDYAKSTNTPVSVFVLSPDGEIVDAHRMDGQNSINTDTALLKAKTALYLRDSTHAAANRFRTLDARVIREDLHMYLVSGGLPIVVDDQMIGAIGVGGGNADEQCAYQALIKVLGPQPPLAPNMPPDPLGQGGGPGGGGGGAGRGGAGAAGAAPQGGR
jgi:glc operon protein GlcG